MRPFYPILFLLLTWLPTAVFAQTIASFSPASGNVGTLVTLTGTGLNLVTAVTLNGTSCVLLDQTSTSLHLLVMPGATSGPFSTTGGAPAASTSSFNVTATALSTTQQGPKLVGTGAVGVGTQQGYSVALSADGNTLAVGGNGDNNSGGATWVFARTGTTWSQQGPKLVGTGAIGTRTQQGQSVALSADGNTLAVGGSGDNSNAGATWVFVRTGTTWTQQGPKLVGTGSVGTSFAGYAVALSANGNILAMGAPGDNYQSGATWVFARTGTTWSQQGPKLLGTGGNGSLVQQGQSVALSADGTILAVGAPSDANETGATWVFARTGTTWSQQGPKLVGTGASGLYGAAQGTAIALSADGSTLAASGKSDNRFAGATWVFTRTGTTWSQQGPKLVGTGAGTISDAFQGTSVALSADGNTLAAGGNGDNGEMGATWVFTRTGTTWSQQGPKLVGTGAALGSVRQGQSVALSADGSTLATGGLNDNNRLGATWVFSTASAPLAQRAVAEPQASAHFFPNPVIEQLTIRGGVRNGTLRLFDGTGRTLLTSGYHDGQPLNLSTLPAGLYWLQVDRAPARPLIKR